MNHDRSFPHNFVARAVNGQGPLWIRLPLLMVATLVLELWTLKVFLNLLFWSIVLLLYTIFTFGVSVRVGSWTMHVPVFLTILSIVVAFCWWFTT